MTGDGVVQLVDRSRWLRTPDFWWSAIRIALVALWFGWAALTWWTAPRPATVAEARADLSARRVASYEWADEWVSDGSSRGWASTSPTLRSSGTAGPLFVWRTTTGRIRYVVMDHVPRASGSFPATTGVDASMYSGPEAASLGVEAPAVGESGGVETGPLRPIMALTPLVGLLVLGIIVAGPAPVTGTRWFWFWLVCGAPFGLGLLYWLGQERPWSRAALPRAGPTGKEVRRRGFTGFLLVLLASIVIGLLSHGLNRLLGSAIVPLPAG